MSRRLVPIRQFPRVRQGEIFEPPPIVEVRLGDVPDPRVIDGEVSLSILRGPPGGELVGETTARCPGGVATFPGLRATVPGEYVFIAECNEAGLELIPRPSGYRYYGSFPVAPGLTVTISGNGTTTGTVTEVGDGFVIVSDASSVSQQSVVAGAGSVTVDGVAASAWFAADAPGIDVSDSSALWEVDGEVATEKLGRFPPMTVARVLDHPVTNGPSPLGPDKSLVTTAPTTAYRYAETEDEGVPSIPMGAVSGPGTTILYLATYPAPNLSRDGILSQLLAFPFNLANAVETLSQGTGLSAARVTISAQGGTGPLNAIPLRRGPRGWFLLGLRYFRLSSNNHRVSAWINGEYVGDLVYNYSGGPTTLRQLRHAINNGASFSQAGIWHGPMPDEWHLEQARRCGVAP